jgi:hypothetical protein
MAICPSSSHLYPQMQSLKKFELGILFKIDQRSLQKNSGIYTNSQNPEVSVVNYAPEENKVFMEVLVV